MSLERLPNPYLVFFHLWFSGAAQEKDYHYWRHSLASKCKINRYCILSRLHSSVATFFLRF